MNAKERLNQIAQTTRWLVLTILCAVLLSLAPHAQASSKLYYVHNDHLGARVVTDSAKTVVWKAQRQPYGETKVIVNTITFDPRFPGQTADSESSLHQNYLRTYDPSTGRYLEADPIGQAGGINLYAYVGGDPVNLADPLGLRDVVVAIWTSRFLEGSVGHVYVGELNGSTILSQFPDRRWFLGANTTLTWLNTVRAEGRSADYVYQVTLANDAAFDAAAAAARNIPTWFAFPDGSTTTQCATAASTALRAGGVKGLPLGNPSLPNYLNTTLRVKSWYGSQIFRLPAAPW